MLDDTYKGVADDPRFAELIRKRNRFALTLSAIVLIVYYAFVLFASLQPAGFAAPLASGLTWPLGLAIGWGIQVFAFLMTGIYVRRANTEFDALNRAILEGVAR